MGRERDPNLTREPHRDEILAKLE